jgi:uncharacterized membrane protein
MRIDYRKISGETGMATSIGTNRLLLSRAGGGQRGLSTAKESRVATRVNVGKAERQISLAAGVGSVAIGIGRRDLPGLLIAAIGAGLVYRGASGHCSVYDALGVDSRIKHDPDDHQAQPIRVTAAFLIDKPVEELYRFWRNLENLPTIMSHLESVRVTDEKHSHWIAKAPKIAGGSVEWDAEIVEDRPNERIAWRSLPDADVDNRGSVEFTRAHGDRGSVVRVKLDYSPPAGRVGSWLAKLFGESPESQIREDLRRFKRVMEIGENLTTEGQSRGSCFGGVGHLMS